MLKNVYDVFIAYHGSYDKSGTLKFAEHLYDELTEQGYSVFFSLG